MILQFCISFKTEIAFKKRIVVLQILKIPDEIKTTLFFTNILITLNYLQRINI